jgi:hypothetical protein
MSEATRHIVQHWLGGCTLLIRQASKHLHSRRHNNQITLI